MNRGPKTFPIPCPTWDMESGGASGCTSISATPCPASGTAHGLRRNVDLQSPGLRRMIVNAACWSMGMEAAITPDRSVAIVDNDTPLGSSFNHPKLGVVPKPVNTCR